MADYISFVREKKKALEDQVGEEESNEAVNPQDYENVSLKSEWMESKFGKHPKYSSLVSIAESVIQPQDAGNDEYIDSEGL